MNVYLCFVFAVSSIAFPLETENWPFEMNSLSNFIEDQSAKVEAFFEEQKNAVEHALNASYDEAMRMKNSVTNYVEDQEKKITASMNNFVESGRKIADSWSYVQTEDPGARVVIPDILLSVPSRITYNGYTCETHTVMSQGYILNIHRIPTSKNSEDIPKNTVILQHGLLGSSGHWILNGPDKSLGYVLADAGYDVWMPNIRGNKYSKEHAVLKNDSKSFWNFSWHDVALHDLPTIIDHILKRKGKDTKITYIGHSMGTTILFAMLTLRPEYNSILKAGLALAPEVFFTDLKSPIKALAPIASDVAYMEMLYDSHEFLPKDSMIGRMTEACNADGMDFLVCKNVLFYICGYSEKQFNKALLPLLLSNSGTGTSWKTAVHFAQQVVAGGKFQQFDYGKEDNLRVYGEETPPEYDLSRVTLPIKLFWAENDLLSSQKDVQILYEKLPSTTEIYKVSDPDFNHLDYLWAVDAPTLINNEILKYLNKQYSS